jgi:hypothetical protein
MIRKIKGLSSNPGTALLQALDDLEKVEKLKKVYRVNMMAYHAPNKGRCDVCLAGAVMMARDAAKPSEFLAPWYFDADKKLRAISEFNFGDFGTGLEKWPGAEGFVSSILQGGVPNYAPSPARYKTALREKALILQREWRAWKRKAAKV